MIPRHPHARRRKRGVVLILILAMLGLLALIGVTFATFSMQAKISGDYWQQKVAQTSPDQVIDFGLDQLINDSSNYKSAIRGHSLLRDMYGRDYFTDQMLNPAQTVAYQNIHLSRLPEPNGQPLMIMNVQAQSASTSTPQTPFIVSTNIPTALNYAEIRKVPQLAGANFTGNLLRLQQWVLDATDGRFTPLRQVQTANRLTQTFEIVGDDRSGAYHVFTLTIADQTTAGNTAFVQPEPYGNVTPPGNFSIPNGAVLADIFEIDGRYMHGFNGMGQGTMVTRNTANSNDHNNYTSVPLAVTQNLNGVAYNFPYSAYPNYLYNRIDLNSVPVLGYRAPLGLNDPNARPYVDSNGMVIVPPQHDEDYDAPDNENVWLSLQTPDGAVVIPSFHRPGNIVYSPTDPSQNDWNDTSLYAQAKFLRPRKKDHPQSGDSFPDLIPDPSTGKITYDVDNDGDGVTDSVWVDLGYPVQREPSGRKYKPLFAFMVQGLNGRLPLNTAGNLNKIVFNQVTQLGTHTPAHASHIGYSVNEINPEYALAPSTSTNGAPADGQKYLQVLLQGNPNQTPPAEGRWGEVDIIKASMLNGGQVIFPRAGRSYYPNDLSRKFDAFDTDFNGFDFYPNGGNNHPEQFDLTDNAGRAVLPVERMRRFVTPVDLSGNGRMMPYGQVPYSPDDYGLGYDTQGRVAFFLHYRPPGIPAGVAPDTTDYSTNTLNKLHGYESYRNPDGPNVNNVVVTDANGNPILASGSQVTIQINNANRNAMAIMPSDQYTVDPTTMKNVVGLSMPSFSALVNSNDPITAQIPDPTNPMNTLQANDPTQNVGMFVGGSQALSDAAQMNLYAKTSYDAPFGIADQEYLDRGQDIDAASLSNRLSRLLPDIFETDANKTLKRRLFVTETWDLNTWSAPTGSMGPVFGQPTINASLASGTDSFLWTDVARMPSLAQGNRRFNINLPLPRSTSSTEPVRQKYVRELYQILKASIAPPDGSSLSAYQLAALGQYAVNVVDFRDPDDTMTKFVNYDLVHVDPATGQVDANTGADVQSGGTSTIIQAASVAKATGTSNSAPVIQWGMEYSPIAISEVLGYQFIRYDTPTKKQAMTPRLFIELVNTLTEDYYKSGNGRASDLDLNGWGFIITQDNPQATPPADTTTAPVERPNMVTGQLSDNTISNYFVPLAGTGVGTTAAPAPLAKTIKAIDQSGSATVNYYTMGNYINGLDPRPPGTSPPLESDYQLQAPAFTIDGQISDSLINQIPMYKTVAPSTTANPLSEYYWIHLLRPANPHAADLSKEPKVVVDSFRFPYFNADGVATLPGTSPPTVTQGSRAIYSVKRRQPYRGGHFVPRTDSASHYAVPNPYGYTEQTFPSTDGVGFGSGTGAAFQASLQGNYIDPSTNQAKPITGPIFHSLDKGGAKNDNWDHFPFQDRDFQSLAELFLVPVTPPGLFTKKFVELPDPTMFAQSNPPQPTGDLPPPTANGPAAGAPPPTPPWINYYYPPPFVVYTPPTTPPTNGGAVNPVDSPTYSSAPTWGGQVRGVQPMPDPAAFPYLPEAFYYSWDDLGKSSFGGKSGWYRALEFLEVPSTSMGYIGPVAAGQNADWARQDLRPGLLNLNLIFDEEVFFGLLDDRRVNAAPAFADASTAYYAYNLPPFGSTTTNPIGVGGFPRVATAIYANGMPSYTVPAVSVQTQANPNAPPALLVTGDRGFPYTHPAGTSQMKAAFADFLKLRDGGSGLVYSPLSTMMPLWGNPNGTVAMPSRPFRSLATADINDTVLRPARLPVYQQQNNPGVYEDMGVYPGWLYPRNPPRRLFQIPDADPNVIFNTGNRSDLSSETNTNNYVISSSPGTVPPPPPNDHIFLSNTNSSLFFDTTDSSSGPSSGRRGYLGSSTPGGGGGGQPDHRWHPAFRTEMMSKVMNQTTVRTHQFAVWLTVGFFEVVREGNPQMADVRDPNTNVSLAVDLLGPEIGAAAGKQVRYRSYFLIDRTKATGFNPFDPGDFRDVIVFSRRIE